MGERLGGLVGWRLIPRGAGGQRRVRRDSVSLDQQSVQHDQYQQDAGDHHHVGAVEPHQDRHAVGEVRGEPEAGAAEKVTELDVVTEGLVALLVPLEHGPGEDGEQDQAEHRDADQPVALISGNIVLLMMFQNSY